MNRLRTKSSLLIQAHARMFSINTNVMQNQHNRYIPKRRLKFDY